MSRNRGGKVHHPRKEVIIPVLPPLYPTGGCKPIPISNIQFRRSMEAAMSQWETTNFVKSNFGVSKPKLPGHAFNVDRYTDSYPDIFKVHPADEILFDPLAVAERIPLELRPNAPKTRIDRKKVLEERAKRKFEEMSLKNDDDEMKEGEGDDVAPAKRRKIDDDDDGKEEKEGVDGDGGGGGEEAAEKKAKIYMDRFRDEIDTNVGLDDELDEELDEGTDYMNNFFDNGEDYLESDHDNDDGPIY